MSTVKSLFYIEREKFLRNMLEMASISESVELFTTEDIVRDFHFIADILPELIVLDIQTVIDDVTWFFENLDNVPEAAQIPVLVTGSIADLDLISEYRCRILGIIKKPITTKNIAQVILAPSKFSFGKNNL
ncbi:MAG: hypothetical protein ISR65_08490 [Bacteriovoracaceae bacterium]|nr:hypothetical protein [Bacteriovoracaceae bacterium]